MLLYFVLLLVGFLPRIWSLPGLPLPTCVPKCWENSRYVSTCSNQADCLCKDDIFQSAFLQCLYSQCQTSQFGSALHHALSKCSTLEPDSADISPPLIRQGLRKKNKRAEEKLYGQASPSALGSLFRKPASVSAAFNQHPTRSVGNADLEKRNAHPTGSVATLDLEKRNASPTSTPTPAKTSILNLSSTTSPALATKSAVQRRNHSRLAVS